MEFRVPAGCTPVALLVDVNRCPSCGEEWSAQERRPDGNRSCVNKHSWKRTVAIGVNEPAVAAAKVDVFTLKLDHG